MDKLRWKLSEWLVRMANKCISTPGKGYEFIDNINFIDRTYLESYLEYEPEKTVKGFLNHEGWIDVTGENAQMVINDLNRAVEINRQMDEQSERNG